MSDFYEGMMDLLRAKESGAGQPYFPLARTLLCLDCDALSLGPVCPACASTQCVPVAKFLDRKAVPS